MPAPRHVTYAATAFGGGDALQSSESPPSGIAYSMRFSAVAIDNWIWFNIPLGNGSDLHSLRGSWVVTTTRFMPTFFAPAMTQYPAY